MTIYHLPGFGTQTPDLKCDQIPRSTELSALLNLVIPSVDDLLPPIETTCNFLEYASPQSPLPYPMFVHEEAASASLGVLDDTKTKSGWLESMPFIGPESLAHYADAVIPFEILMEVFALPMPQTLQAKPSKNCEVAGCNTKKQSNGRCIRHGGGRRCQVEGCIRGAQTMGRCKRHGGGARCTVDGCTSSSQGGGLCRSHGGGKLCTAPGCKKGAQRQGKCAMHASRKCKVHDCSTNARCQDLCRRHMKEQTAESTPLKKLDFQL
ncbi:hypothetical protein GN244_ATG11482 [Phytophthora infestans]|uniref:WRKY19-like zinc finger domain-containing protein n=1 Tax=Phytophthora infestans TaxID=4787 RepID=A0A833S8K0_PHYIN|nr:hypothetical protein GN244_ATG11482 [Phytophthora infestans]KAF4128738.1 hypothetical protein GN958_ATG22160 [Phytophthora infestans]